jgi:glycosyltransferase involved in cell wall biosynthesis
MHILQVSLRVPYPPHDGGAIGIYNITAGLLRAGHRVTMLAANTPKHHQPATALDHLGPNLRLIPVDVNTNLSPVAALKNLLLSSAGPLGIGTKIPYNVERFISLALAEKLLELLQTEAIDVVQLEGTFVAWYGAFMQRQKGTPGLLKLPPTVLRMHNVEYKIWETLALREGNPLKKWYFRHLAERLAPFETWAMQHVDAVAPVTEDDAVRLRAMGSPVPVVFIPAAVELNLFKPDPSVQPKPLTLFMVGSLNWMPNLEGVEWLLREVWPTLHAELPQVALHIAGTGTPAHLLAPRTDNVFFHGFVESAPAFMQRYDLMVAPMLSGSGIKVKVIEGMALGKPILSTTIGAEGIEARDGQNLLVRDGAAAWLEVLRAWARGQIDGAALGAAARHTAIGLYDTDSVAQGFTRLYQQLVAPVVVPQ